jgi:hypothetical protein
MNETLGIAVVFAPNIRQQGSISMAARLTQFDVTSNLDALPVASRTQTVN